jgi:hypothetical protein
MLMSLVHILVRNAARLRSPELAPPRPSAPPCYASSTSPDRSYLRPRLILRTVFFTPALSAHQIVLRRSNPSKLAGAPLQPRRPRACVHTQPSNVEPTVHICSDPGQPVSVPVNTAMHCPFCKRNPDLPLFHAYGLPQFKSN